MRGRLCFACPGAGHAIETSVEDVLRRFSVVIFSFLLITGCSDSGRLEEPPRPNILLISIDALRADHLSCYGYERPTTPFLDELAETGTRFSNAFVNTHGTPPSHTTMLSSLYQESHRVGFGAGTPEGRNDRVPADVEMVQEILQRAGWYTLAVTGGGYMSATFGFDRGFDVFQGGAPAIEVGTKMLLNQLENRPPTPVFAMLHTYQVHSPYQPPEEYAALWDTYESDLVPTNEHLKPIQRTAGKILTDDDFGHLEALYDGEIRFTDDVLRDFFARLEDMGLLDDCLIIITSDHGEEFGDHGGLLHSASLYDELLRVPLIIAGSAVPATGEETRLVSLIDLAPTILAAAGLPATEIMEGRNLLDGSGVLPLAQQRIYAQYADRLYGIRTPRWKIIQTSKNEHVQLFDLEADPQELRNVAQQRVAIADGLLGELEAWKKTCADRVSRMLTQPELTPEKIEELRALGYTQ